MSRQKNIISIDHVDGASVVMPYARAWQVPLKVAQGVIVESEPEIQVDDEDESISESDSQSLEEEPDKDPNASQKVTTTRDKFKGQAIRRIYLVPSSRHALIIVAFLFYFRVEETSGNH